MKIQKGLLTFLFTVAMCNSYAQQNSAPPQTDSVDVMKLYLDLKREYTRHEKEHGHYIQTNNVRLHYLTWGNPKATPLVWLHATYSAGYELYEIADSLVKMGFYLIAIDYYGHGLTPIPNKEVSLFHVADDVHFLLEQLRIKKAIIGGWSRGGSIATAFYDAYPESVSALILEDGGSVAWSMNDHKKSIDSLTTEIRNGYKDRRPPHVFESEFLAYNFIYGRFFRNLSEVKLKKETFSFFTRIKQDSIGAWRMMPGINNFIGLQTAEQYLTLKFRPLAANTLFAMSSEVLNPRIIYRNLNVPMIIFDPINDPDAFIFEKENKELQQEHPEYITLKVYQHTGHHVKDEHPQQFVADLKEFFKANKLMPTP